jgi:DNA polymerase (family 10)
MSKNQPTNKEIADTLDRIAGLLEVQNANPHRVRAYRNGAERARTMERSLADIVRSGDGQALKDLPDIGEGLASIITRYVESGHSGVLERLRGEVSPEQLFMMVPGIGEELSKRIVDQLDIHSLEELEQAAHDGRLAQVEGFGDKRVRMVEVSLAGMLSRGAQRRAQQRTGRINGDGEKPKQPAVETLLDLDREYRRKAEAGELPTIKPKRFNPEGKSWLPILHESSQGYHFTVLFSNTGRAHDLNKTHDWVVIYYEWNGREDQATVVTATRGPLEGKRIVRGREIETRRYYDQLEEPWFQVVHGDFP